MRAPALLFLLSGTGCLPFACGTPPLQIGAGGRGIVTERTGLAERLSAADVRADLRPLQVVPSLSDRVADFGVGYGVIPFSRREGATHGPPWTLSGSTGAASRRG